MLWHYLREGWHILLTLQCKCFDSANVSFRTNTESWQIHSAEKPPGWYIIHPQRWSLTTCYFFIFFLLVWNHRENHKVLWLLLYVKLRNWSCPHLFFLRRLWGGNLVSSFESKFKKVSHQVKWANDSSLAPVHSVLNQKRLAYLAFG